MEEEKLKEEYLATKFIKMARLTQEFNNQNCKLSLNFIKKNGYVEDFEQYKKDRMEGYTL